MRALYTKMRAAYALAILMTSAMLAFGAGLLGLDHAVSGSGVGGIGSQENPLVTLHHEVVVACADVETIRQLAARCLADRERRISAEACCPTARGS